MTGVRRRRAVLGELQELTGGHRKSLVGRCGDSTEGQFIQTLTAEQKNWSVVRQTIGYQRYELPQALALLPAICTDLRLYGNFFCSKLLLHPAGSSLAPAG